MAGTHMDDQTVAAMAQQLPSLTGQVMAGAPVVARRTIQGRSLYTIQVSTVDGMRGQLVVYNGQAATVIVAIEAQAAAFGRTAGFRRNFFARRVRVR